MHPLFDELATKYRYGTLTGWAFEDGACPLGHRNNEEQWCDCPRPWSDAWEALCDAPYAVGYKSYEQEYEKIRQAMLAHMNRI